MKEVTDIEMRKLIAASDERPLLVDFWAPWCAPCRALAPTLERVSKAWEDRIDFVKVNTQEFPTAGRGFDLLGVPTLILFRDGAELDRVVGGVGEQTITAVLGKHAQGTLLSVEVVGLRRRNA